MNEPRTRQERIFVEILSTLKNIEKLLDKENVSQETQIKKKKEVKK